MPRRGDDATHRLVADELRNRDPWAPKLGRLENLLLHIVGLAHAVDPCPLLPRLRAGVLLGC